jgi:hypothetical protein
MFRKIPDDRMTPRSGLRLGLILVAVLGFGIWGFATWIVGSHVTDCGFDAQGVYAKVRVNNVLGGEHDQSVWVKFYLRDDVNEYEAGVVTARVPAHGYGTAVVHERFPPNGRFGDPTAEDANVEGLTVYRSMGPHLNFDPPQDWRFVTTTFAEKHPARISIETVPFDPWILHCSVGPADGD